MTAFAWWLGMVVVEFGLCMVAALTASAWGYPEAGEAFVRCALVIAGVGGASCVALAVFMVAVRARAGAGLSGDQRLRAGRTPASQHGPIKSGRV
jgi:hypothetical protein